GSDADGADQAPAQLVVFALQTLETRRLGQRQVDLEDRRVDLDRLDVPQILRRQLGALDQLEVGALRVGVREDGPSLEVRRSRILAAGEDDAGGAPVPDPDLLDLAAGADGHARLAGGRLEGARHAAHAAAD